LTSKPLSFMLIDDDVHTQRIFSMVLKHHAHKILVAGNADEAYDLLREYTPNIIIIDLLLPGADGYQICDRIHHEGLAPNARLVATTAYHSVGTSETTLSRGFDSFLAKPLNPADLVPFLEQLADQP
jgi:two-component system cell cycle response regulator DivK